MMNYISKWQARIARIKQEIIDLGPMRPGSISEQYNVCGNPRCICKDPENPKKHGPYFQLSYTHQGKSTTEFVTKENVDEVRGQVNNYHLFKALIKEWIELSVKIAKEQRTRNK